MGIVSQSDENNATLSNGFTSVTINAGITVSDLTRAELIIDVRGAQAIGQTRNYSVTGNIFNDLGVTKIIFQRGGNQGVLICHYILKEYTIASGVVVHRGEMNMNTNPTNILVPAETRANTYARVNSRNPINIDLSDVLLTYKITTDTNLQVQGQSNQTNTTISWQTIYIPDQTVFNVETDATGASCDIDITSLGLLKDNTFCIQSMRFVTGFKDVDGLKGVELTSDINLNVYSFFSETHRIITQLVYRPNTKVQRVVASYSTTPFSVLAPQPFSILDTFIQVCAPFQYFIPSNDFTNNSQQFACTTQILSTTEVSLQKFLGGKSSKAVVEFVELDGNPIPTTSVKWNYYTMNRKRGR